MSLLSVPFVGTGADTALHVVAGVVLVATIAAACYGFWRVHELPINKAHSKEHQQLGLITALTWIGFIWHWVWVLAVILAFVDMEKAIINLRDTWKTPAKPDVQPEQNDKNEENPVC
ncbi:MFS transporter [Vibrio cyclitrophicus ZF264]|uniref:MFS transporter n=1 Tax=Vibrio TaxID=662 RepID=UPI000303E982|nr:MULTISPECIES: MFS transporter [Vibrio]MBE8556492.1 MFS transporter [Vibrio sp. OPT24]OEE05894.1 MFS transporter [Vibrio cyclitrophicus ZF264]PMH56321.1 MFS transporter [Vibrio cyclitrophicus]PMK98158.1 MFS transporter [Vibrio cyclitrophicus]